MTDLPRGTVTLLFSDIEASTEVMKRLGDAWPGVLDRHRVAACDELMDRRRCQSDAIFQHLDFLRHTDAHGRVPFVRADGPEVAGNYSGGYVPFNEAVLRSRGRMRPIVSR